MVEMDDEIAGIYEKLLRGDNTGLSALQQIKKTRPPPSDDHQFTGRNIDNKSDKNIDNDNDKNIERNIDKNIDRSIDRNIDKNIDRNMDRSSDEFKKYLKDKISKVGSVKQQPVPQFRIKKQEQKVKGDVGTQLPPIKREVKSTNGKPQSKNETITDMNARHSRQIQSQNISSPIKMVRLNEGEENNNKNYGPKKSIAPSQIESIKSDNNQKSSPAGKGGQSKQIRENFNRINEEERRHQLIILQEHKQTKQIIQQIKHKYSLTPQQPNPLQQYGREKQAITRLQSQLLSIQSLLAEKKRELQKQQSKIARSIVQEALTHNMNKISQESENEEEEAQQVEPLVAQGTRYAAVMAETRDKKWLLRKRVEYNVHQAIGQSRTHNLQAIGESKSHNVLPSVDKIGQSPYVTSEKMTVNQKLRNLLLD